MIERPWLKGPRRNVPRNPDQIDLLYETACQQIKKSLDCGDVIRDSSGNLVFKDR